MNPLGPLIVYVNGAVPETTVNVIEPFGFVLDDGVVLAITLNSFSATGIHLVKNLWFNLSKPVLPGKIPK